MSERRRSDVPFVGLDIGDARYGERLTRLLRNDDHWCVGPLSEVLADELPFAVVVGPGQRSLKDAVATVRSRFPACIIVAAMPAKRADACATIIAAGADHVFQGETPEAFAECTRPILERLHSRMLPFGLPPLPRPVNLPCPLVFVDNRGTVRVWNEAAVQLFDIAVSNAIGQPIDGLLKSTPSVMEQLEKCGDDLHGESQLRRRGGETLTCQWRACRVGKDGWGLVFDDVTARVQVEHELREAIRAADAANKAKSEFLAVMSHEIRTPMNSIVGFTELLLDSDMDERQRDYMEIVRSNGLSLLELINNILEFSRIESGKVEVEPSVVDLHELLAGVVDSLWVEASRKGIELYSRVSDDVPRRVKAVEGELRRILLNLTANAIKFTDRGSVQIFLHLMYANDRYDLLFKVNDTGIGIPEDKADRLFKSFSQIDSSSTRKHGGTGLGLAISKKLCEAMGGRMWVQSVPGKGSTFYFTLPLEPVDPVDLPPPAENGSENGAHDGQPGKRETSLRILVAEDEPMNQLLVQRFLSKLGHESELANNGAHAIERLRSEPYHMVLMDVQMPEMDGLKAARLIRDGQAGDGYRDIFICALTAYAMAGDQERCMQAGMNDYLSKPLSIACLKRVIDRVAATVQSA